MSQIGAQPQFQLHTLTTADGSTTYISPSSTHTLTAGVNYPIEVPYRSDEDPEGTHVEVSVRPHNGVAMVRERYIEELVRRTLKTVIIGEDTPRTCLQATIQVISMQEDETLPGGVKGGGQGEGWLDLLVGCVNASIGACLDAGVRMNGLVCAVLVGVKTGGEIMISPDVRTRKECANLHAFAYNKKGACVLMESQGRFGMDVWQIAERLARNVVCGGDVDGKQFVSVFEVLRKAVEARVDRDERWKE
jgi:exosome complex component RRP46